jgi:hypothetical protein
MAAFVRRARLIDDLRRVHLTIRTPFIPAAAWPGSVHRESPTSYVSVNGVVTLVYEAGIRSARVCARASRHQMNSYA